MKRFTAAALIICLCFTNLTGCSGGKIIKEDNVAIQTALIYEFNKISQIPRESGHERAISNYLKSWAKGNKFDVSRDNSNNIIIDIPATPGYEKAPTTILECNMDTAIAVSNGAIFNPLYDQVKIVTGKGIIKAEGTSLGADSGIGIATIMYVLKNSVNHGPLRAVFTTDGESGLTGAEKLNSKYLQGNYLINLGWASSKTVLIGSGCTATYEMSHEIQWTAPKNELPYLISINGLIGGDGENDIGKGRANAIKVIGEILANAQGHGILYELASINGGNSKYTIPTDASALIVINRADQEKLQNIVDDAIKTFKASYGDVESNYNFVFQETKLPDHVVSFESNGSIISFIYGIVDGVQSMAKEYKEVESSSNLGMVSTTSGDFKCFVSASSNTDAGINDITEAHAAISNMSSFKYEYFEGVPLWTEHTDSILFSSVSNIYSDLFGKKISASILHHKHECGWFAQKNPDLQIVSIGPMIKNVNTPTETLELNTITRPANIIMAFLEQNK